MPSMVTGGRAIILKSLSTLDYDCHYNCTVDVDDWQAGRPVRRDTGLHGRQDGRFGENIHSRRRARAASHPMRRTQDHQSWNLPQIPIILEEATQCELERNQNRSSLAELKRHRSCDSCDAERSNACHRSARPCYEWRRLTVSPCFRNSAHGTATEDKVLSDAHSARLTPAARSRPSLSLFARPGDQAPTVQTDPAPSLGCHRAVTRPNCCRPRRAVRRRAPAPRTPTR